MLSFFIFFTLLFSFLFVPDMASNAAILHVSIPAGEDRTGISVQDPWLNECWFLNVTSSSVVFTIKIEDVSGSIFSYDTHLVIALNFAAYTNLVSLAVDNVTMVKNDFKYGRLRPYNLRNWPSGDVYPTWFNDTLVNVGTITPKGHVNVTVSATFSDATGVRMHFDAYGSKKSSPAPSVDKLYLTRNPLSEDSTVVFWSPILTPPVACFTVSDPSPQVYETVLFNASCSSDPDGWIANYTWNFGDGNITTVEYPIIKYHYDVFGNHTVTLTIADNEGVTDITSKPMWVRAHPRADFTWSPFYPEEDQTVAFDASASTPNGGTILGYSWNFGDGTTGTGKYVTHAYTAAGTYTVTLTVTDSEDKLDVESKQITVKASHQPPVAVGGHATPISIRTEKAESSSLLPPIGLFLTLLVIIAGILLTKGRKKTLKREY